MVIDEFFHITEYSNSSTLMQDVTISHPPYPPSRNVVKILTMFYLAPKPNHNKGFSVSLTKKDR